MADCNTEGHDFPTATRPAGGGTVTVTCKRAGCSQTSDVTFAETNAEKIARIRAEQQKNG